MIQSEYFAIGRKYIGLQIYEASSSCHRDRSNLVGASGPAKNGQKFKQELRQRNQVLSVIQVIAVAILVKTLLRSSELSFPWKRESIRK